MVGKLREKGDQLCPEVRERLYTEDDICWVMISFTYLGC